MNVPLTDNKVLKFPLLHDETNPPTLEIAAHTIAEIKAEYCKETTEFVFEQTIGIMKSFGYFLDPNKGSMRDLEMVEEAIMSAVCRYSNVPHPMHELTDSMFEDDEEVVGDTAEVPAEGMQLKAE